MSLLPVFDRRRMLLGLAAASTAATTPLAAAATPAENPALLALAAELPAFVKRYQNARARQDAIEAEWIPQWPVAPDEITKAGSARRLHYDMERTFGGAALHRKGEENPRELLRSWHFRAEAGAARRALQKKKIEAQPDGEAYRTGWEAKLAEIKRLEAVAKRYEDEIARIKAGSTDYEPSWKAHSEAAKALGAHISAMMAEPETTMEGLLIKAQALAAWDGVAYLYRQMNFRGADWPGQIAASILRHARAAA